MSRETKANLQCAKMMMIRIMLGKLNCWNLLGAWISSS
jgi:hypothetical protein